MPSNFIQIQSLNRNGWGVGRLDRMRVEVPGTLPQEEVELQEKKGGRRRLLKQIITASAARIPARCPHVPECGGCVWQQMNYEAQLQHKQERLKEIFSEDHNLLQPIIPCKEPWRYRNKMEFSFSQNKAGEKFLGLIMAASRGYVLTLRECHLVPVWFSLILEAVRTWWDASDLTAFRLDGRGTLRTLTLRGSNKTGRKLVMLTVSGNPLYALKNRDIARFIAAVESVLPEENVAIFLRIQQTCKGAPTEFFEMHLKGPDHLLEKCTVAGREFLFKISPSSFFQPNTLQAEKLYEEALKMTHGEKRHILDLYAGIGTLGMVFSGHGSQVTSIELNPYAVCDAESNKEINQLTHYHMLCGDVGKVLEELRQKQTFIPPDLVIVDPPRSGLDKRALENIRALQPEEIIYISCNPHTQADNIEELKKTGYTLQKLQPIDQFPHTVHIENIAHLVRK